MSRRPICVISGDIHFTLQTLDLATLVVRQMIGLSKMLNVPMVLNGDTLDAKAIIRGEIANRLIELLEPEDPTKIYINRGNHDAIHERSSEHSLNFLKPYAQVISTPTYMELIKSWIVPYFADNIALQAFLDTVPKGSRLIMHQGIVGADMGSYVKDSSSLTTDSFADFRVWSSHYHRRQDIKCGRPRKGGVGMYSFIGSAYTVTFTEANDGPKGINIGYDDGSLELVPTNLRKHVVLDYDTSQIGDWSRMGSKPDINPEDLVWLKLRGPSSDLAKVKKADMAKLLGVKNLKFDRLPTEVQDLVQGEDVDPLTDMEVFDLLVDQTDESAAQKAFLKSLARETINAA